MIAKSDIVILTLASMLLAFGFFRVQGNTSQELLRSNSNVSKQRTANPTAVATIKQSPENSVTRQTSPTDSVNVVVLNANQNNTEIDSQNVTVQSNEVIVDQATYITPPAVQENLTKAELQGATVVVEASTQIDQNNPPEDTGGILLMVHRVKSGEYLSLLAQRYGTTVEQLQELNDISGTTIQVGQELIYPAAR